MAKTTRLQLGGIQLPADAVTETFVVLGKRGSGKTTMARVMSEELLTAGMPVVIIDPIGVWWGLRSSADGKGDGHPVVIFGGDHADVPLEETAGRIVADVIIDRRIPAVLDLSGLSKAAARRLCADFLEQLYHRNRDPLHLVVDEADLIAPQRTFAGVERLLGAIEDVVRRGRARGLGCTLITQRPAVLHKDVLSQAEVLVALRMTSVRDVAAIDEWVRLHADEDEAKTVKSSLPSLPIGTAWFWSPGWLDVLERVKIRRPSTFDSSATPTAGTARTAVRRMAPIDLAALGEQITATVERVKADDPKALRAQIAKLTRELDAAKKATPEPTVERIEVPVLDDQLVAALDETIQQASVVADAFNQFASELTTALRRVHQTKPAPVQARPRPQAPTRPARPASEPPAPRDGALSKAERNILTVLGQHGTLNTTQVAILAGYSYKSGGYRNALSSLRTAGYIDGRGEVTATDDGMLAVGDFEPLPTGADLRRWWQSQKAIGRAESRILDVLADAYPSAVDTATIADLTEYSPSSGGFRNALSRLRSLALAEGRGELTVNASLI